MLGLHIKPYNQQQAAKEARERQTHAFRRNQIFGWIILAAIIFLWWLFHTNPAWIFPSGWWRL